MTATESEEYDEMAQPSTAITYAHKSAIFVEQRARGDLAQTLEQTASQLEHAATALRRRAAESHVPVTERVDWAQHEIASLMRKLDATDDHLGGVALVWADARDEAAEADALLEAEQNA